MVFSIHWQESATGVHVFPILNPLPPPSSSHPSGLSQCTSPEHPVSCIEPGLAICFIYGNIYVSMLFSQIIPPSPSPTESKSLFFTSVERLEFKLDQEGGAMTLKRSQKTAERIMVLIMMTKDMGDFPWGHGVWVCDQSWPLNHPFLRLEQFGCWQGLGEKRRRPLEMRRSSAWEARQLEGHHCICLVYPRHRGGWNSGEAGTQVFTQRRHVEGGVRPEEAATGRKAAWCHKPQRSAVQY